MCLYSITTKTVATEQEPIIAYKVFFAFVCEDSIAYNTPHMHMGEDYRIGEPVKAKPYTPIRSLRGPIPQLESSQGEVYEAGFHAFRDLKSAKQYANPYGSIAVVVKVKLSGNITYGLQHDEDYNLLPAVVGEYMTLIEEVK